MTEWFARYERDGAFRHELDQAYQGRHAAADALWWLDRPTEDSPSGSASPHRTLEGLQRDAFARPPDAEGVRRSLSALTQFDALTQLLATDRAETQRAIAEALAVLDARPARRRRSVLVLAGASVAAVCLAGALALSLSPGLFGGAGGGAPAVGSALSTGSAAGNGSAIGSSATGGSAGAGGSGGAATGGSSYNAAGGRASELPVDIPASTSPPYPNFPPGVGANSYAAIFMHTQVAADQPPGSSPYGLVAETFRALSVGQNAPGAVYAAISTAGQVCLVVYGDPVSFGYACDDVQTVAARGLQYSLTTSGYTDSTTGARYAPISLSARWQPDGHVALDSSSPYRSG